MEIAVDALAALYAHDCAAGAAQAAANRRQLMAIVVDGKAESRARGVALKALMSTQWPERDAWFLKLFSDSTFQDAQSGGFAGNSWGLFGNPDSRWSLADVVKASPDYWIPRITPLVGGADRPAHENAVVCLLTVNEMGSLFVDLHARVDALRPLLPWLSDANWSENGWRGAYIHAVALRSNMPESVPGLEYVMEHEYGEDFWASDPAPIVALARYHDNDAAALARILFMKAPDLQRASDWLTAMVAGGLVSETQLAAAFEANVRQAHWQWKWGGGGYWEGHVITPDSGWLQWNPQAAFSARLATVADQMFRDGTEHETVLAIVVKRIEEIGPVDPDLADAMLLMLQNCDSGELNRCEVQRLKTSLTSQLVMDMVLRRQWRWKSPPAGLGPLAAGDGVPAGVAAALLDDKAAEARILGGRDRAAVEGLLACARLAHVKLPVEKVGAYLMQGGLLSAAAESYLIAEDSAAARLLVRAVHAGDYLVLGGDLGYGGVDVPLGPHGGLESRPSYEVMSSEEDEVYAFDDVIVRLKGDGVPGVGPAEICGGWIWMRP